MGCFWETVQQTSGPGMFRKTVACHWRQERRQKHMGFLSMSQVFSNSVSVEIKFLLWLALSNLQLIFPFPSINEIFYSFKTILVYFFLRNMYFKCVYILFPWEYFEKSIFFVKFWMPLIHIWKNIFCCSSLVVLLWDKNECIIICVTNYIVQVILIFWSHFWQSMSHVKCMEQRLAGIWHSFIRTVPSITLKEKS